MGPVHNNFISWWQLHILKIGQPDKLLRDLRNSNGSRELSATLMEFMVGGDSHVFYLVFSLCMLKRMAKLQDTAMSLLHSSPSQHFLLRQP
jgi:hypothetical protein